MGSEHYAVAAGGGFCGAAAAATTIIFRDVRQYTGLDDACLITGVDIGGGLDEIGAVGAVDLGAADCDGVGADDSVLGVYGGAGVSVGEGPGGCWVCGRLIHHRVTDRAPRTHRATTGTRNTKDAKSHEGPRRGGHTDFVDWA